MNQRYFIYVRKSTDDLSRQVRSIEDQKAELRELARKEQLHIIEVLEEKQTAKVPGRPVFNSMLDRIERGEASGILAWHPDRLARNSVDGGKIIYSLDIKVLIDLKFCTYTFENTPAGKFMLGIMFCNSKYYVDGLSENIRRGQKQKVLNGIWPNRTPLGYLNDKNTRTIFLDPIRAPLIRKTFELYATGEYTIDRLEQTVNTLGLRNRITLRPRGDGTIYETPQPLCRAQYHRLLTNPFYCGYFVYSGETYEGRHEPIISKELFDKVQEVILDKSKPKTPKLKPFLYRGMFRCGECGCFITTECQKGHHYLRCTKRVKRDCPNPYVREEEISRQLTAAIESVALPSEVADWIIKELEAEWQQSDFDLSAAIRDLQAKATEIDRKLDRLTEAYLGQALSLDEYRATKGRLIDDKQQIKSRITEIEQSHGNWFEPAIRFVKASKQATFLATTGSDSEKRDFFKKTGSNLSVTNRELRWEPREAWQIVQDQSRFAHKHTAASVPDAAVIRGEICHDLHFAQTSGRGGI